MLDFAMLVSVSFVIVVFTLRFNDLNIFINSKSMEHSIYIFKSFTLYIYYYVLLFLVVGYIISLLIFFFYKISSKKTLIKTHSTYFYIKYILFLSFSISTILLIFVFYCYTIYTIYSLNHINYTGYNLTFTTLYMKLHLFSKLSILLSVDFFGVILCILAFFVGLLSFMALDSRFYWKNSNFVLMCHLLCIVIFLFTSVNNIMLLFFFYECLLIPSFLFVYFVSPYRRSIQASLYFLIWTQLGSLFVLLGVGYMYYLTNGSFYKNIQGFSFLKGEDIFLFYLFFFGFGMKIPIWPFHQWLTKTHVEAPAGFSMFLSGFLVKSALFGFYKLTSLLSNDIPVGLCIVILIIGVMDASIKMWGQTDLKKLIAYGTVQEMNMIYVLFCYGCTSALWGGIIFCITHSFLSGLLFYTVDCIQRRYHTRSVVELSGILQCHPTLGVVIFFNCVLYSGLPGTLKFISELYLFSGLFEQSALLCFLLFFVCNYFGFIGFCKCWYNVLFGMTISSRQYISVDLTYKELLIIGSCYFVLIFWVFIDSLVMIN